MTVFFLILIIFIILLATAGKSKPKPKPHIQSNDFWYDHYQDKAGKKIVLCVPLSERDKVRKLGARYDKKYRKLTIPYWMDRNKFAKWIDENSFKEEKK